MPTGLNLIQAIKRNQTLMAIGDCPGVPAQMGKAFYGEWQTDQDETILSSGKKCLENIRSIIEFSGGATDTALWHFDMIGKTHHFVVMPWYKTPRDLVYTVFMAYETLNSYAKSYTLKNYIKGEAPAPSRGVKGYKDIWNSKQLRTMLNKLLNINNLWVEYFGAVDPGNATGIRCYQYPDISLDDSINSVNKYKG